MFLSRVASIAPASINVLPQRLEPFEDDETPYHSAGDASSAEVTAAPVTGQLVGDWRSASPLSLSIPWAAHRMGDST